MPIKPITKELLTNPTRRERRVIRKFHQLYYDSRTGGKPWRYTYWLGRRILKCPMDLWLYQEMLVELKPDFIVETGTAFGASAHYMATICDLIGKGKVITIDIEAQPDLPQHPRLTYLLGSSTDPAIVKQVKATVGSSPVVMVVLDSDHSRDHVLAELKIWSDLVTVGSYCIVEDSNVNGHPIFKEHGPGPKEAIDEFLAQDSRFQIDSSREKFFMTFNPDGFLKRVK